LGDDYGHGSHARHERLGSMKTLSKSHKCHWSERDRIILLESVGLYVSAGLPTDRAVGLAAEGLSRKKRSSMERAAQALKSGRTISSVFSEEIGLSVSMAGLLACGESSGGLAVAFKSAHAVMERASTVKSSCLSALAYPAMIGLVTIGLTIGLMEGVMPQIIPMLKGLNTDLPALTVASIWLSDVLSSHWAVILAALAVLLSSCWGTYRKSVLIRRNVHVVLLCVPIVGSLTKIYCLSILFRSLGAMVGSGIALDRAYDEASAGIPLIPMRDKLQARLERISRGEPLQSVLEGVVPAYALSLISAGQDSGSLGMTMTRTADIMDQRLDQTLKRMTSLIEPVMMLCMGSMVGAVALSIMMPIYEISKTLQH